jgi:hypothetical protein
MLKVAKINHEKNFLYVVDESFKVKNGKKCGKSSTWYFLSVEDSEEWEIGEELGEVNDFEIVTSKETNDRGEPFMWLT